MATMLRKTLFVFFLVIMLSFDPVHITPAARQTRAVVEYVMPVRRGTRYGRFRGRRYKSPALPIENTTFSYQGYQYV
ncbi:MAG: hypothetical protein M5R41_17730 [Bacteroidia bacterium]|nr:hypothetical protein [Bacteroidia bacterium]